MDFTAPLEAPSRRNATEATNAPCAPQRTTCKCAQWGTIAPTTAPTTPPSPALLDAAAFAAGPRARLKAVKFARLDTFACRATHVEKQLCATLASIALLGWAFRCSALLGATTPSQGARARPQPAWCVLQAISAHKAPAASMTAAPKPTTAQQAPAMANKSHAPLAALVVLAALTCSLRKTATTALVGHTARLGPLHHCNAQREHTTQFLAQTLLKTASCAMQGGSAPSLERTC